MKQAATGKEAIKTMRKENISMRIRIRATVVVGMISTTTVVLPVPGGPWMRATSRVASAMCTASRWGALRLPFNGAGADVCG